MARRRSSPREPAARSIALGCAVLLAVVIVGSWLFVDRVTRFGENLERHALQEIASTAAASLEPGWATELAGDATDLDEPVFARVHRALKRTRDAIPSSRFAYLVAIRNGQVVFLADSEDEDSPDYSRPGEVYGEASATMREVFASKRPTTEGPLADRWGDWVSGLAPVLDPRTGQAVAVFGVDIAADRWKAGIARYRWFGIVVAGLIAAIALFSAIFIVFQHRYGVRLAIAKRIAENSSAILYRYDTVETGLPMTFVSGNVGRLGYEPDDFIASPGLYPSIIHPDDLKTVVEARDRLIDEGAAIEAMRLRLRGRDGDYRWFENRATPIRDRTGHVVAVEGILVDVTERELAEEKIRERDATIHSLIEQVIFGIFVADEEGRLAYVNPLFARIAGYESADDYVGRALLDFIADPDKPTVREAMLTLLSGKLSSVEVAVSILQRNGRTIDVLAQSTLASFRGKRAIIGAVIDVTERKRAEEALRVSEAALAEAQAIAHVGSWQVDFESQQLIWSKEHYRIYGVDPATFTPSLEAVLARIHPDDRVAFASAYANSVADHLPFDFDKRIVLDDGSIRFVHDSGRTAYDPAGRPLRLLGTVQDITERKAAEDRILFANTLLTTEMETSPDGILVVDASNHVISHNRRFIDMWNVPRDLLEGDDQPILEIVVAAVKNSEQFLARVKYLYEHHDEAGQDELETSDGRFIDRRTAPLRSSAGAHLGRVWFFRDITERRLAEEAVRVSEQRLRVVFSSVSDGILVTDVHSGRFIDVNPSCCAMFGYAREELIDAEIDIVALLSGVAPYDRIEVMDLIGRARREGAQTVEWQCRRKHGGEFWAEIAIRCAMFGRQEVVLATLRDVSERKEAEAQILRSSRHDGLTGLANRGVFMEAVHQAIARVKRSEKTFAVLYLDLDHFKDVNDTLGHPVGDELLKSVAARLRSSSREIDTVARFGGDEFAVMIADLNEPADAATVADALLGALSEPYSIEGNDIRTGASIGISVFLPEQSGQPDAEALLSQADVALYRAKSEGRGTYRFFTDAMDTEVRTRVTVKAELREAIAANEIFLVYQPLVEIETGKITGVEALARWRHPRRGILGPSFFIPVAETSGLILALGHGVLLAACRQAKEWLDAGIAPAGIAVNLSGMQFKRPLELERDIAAVLAETGLPPTMLELELTETVLMEVSRDHSEALRRLHGRGIRLSIDDFGTGYSSLDYLHRYPVDRIKIAQNFVCEIANLAASAAIVKTTIGLARELGIVVLAEGVESEEQLKLLRAWGCHEVQGFHVAPPLPATELFPLLRAGTITPGRRGATAARGA